MKRRAWLAAIAAAVSVCVASVGSGEPANVLLIIVDDLGWADVSPNHPRTFYETPALAAFAASATNYTRAYSASPVCSPSRVSLMTGVNPAADAATEWFSDRSGRSERFYSADRINYLPNHRRTIAEVLKDAGYQTFFAGKWHLGDEPRHRPEARGFDVNISGSGVGGPGKGGYFAPYDPALGLEGPEGEHLPERLTSDTIAWLRGRDPTRPFLAVLSHYSVHAPLEGRPDLVEKYTARSEALGHAEEDRFVEVEQVWPVPALRRERVKQDHAVYAAMVEAMDEQVGRLLAAIDDLGVAERTVVIFVSDNGGLSTAEGSPTANTPLRGGKGWLYEGGIRVPLMVRWPGVSRPGAVVETPVHGNDVFATMIDAAGLDDVDSLSGDGTSLRDVMACTTPTRPLLFHYPHYSNQGGFPGGAIVRGADKFVLRYEDGRGELYDLASDPSESHDLSAERPELAGALRVELLAWLREQRARLLQPRTADDRPWRPDVWP